MSKSKQDSSEHKDTPAFKVNDKVRLSRFGRKYTIYDIYEHEEPMPGTLSSGIKISGRFVYKLQERMKDRWFYEEELRPVSKNNIGGASVSGSEEPSDVVVPEQQPPTGLADTPDAVCPHTSKFIPDGLGGHLEPKDCVLLHDTPKPSGELEDKIEKLLLGYNYESLRPYTARAFLSLIDSERRSAKRATLKYLKALPRGEKLTAIDNMLASLEEDTE